MNEEDSSKTGSAEGIALSTEVAPALPPALYGPADDRTRDRIHAFYGAAHEFLERWVARSQSKHTQLAYRNSIMQFVRFVGWKWPEESYRFFTVTIVEVTEWRARMLEEQVAPKTINHRITCLSSFYRFLGGCASEARLPITVPNPAHVQFIRRMNDSPVRQPGQTHLIILDKSLFICMFLGQAIAIN